MYFKKIVWPAVAAVIVVGVFWGVPSALHFAGVSARDQEVQNMKEALSLYFAEHQRYPESLEVFFEQSLLPRSIQIYAPYAPSYGYGSYTVCYTDGQKSILSGPPPSEVARNVKLIGLRGRLMQHYHLHGRFPKDLHKFTAGFDPKISEGDYSYSASEDLQSFTLDGDTFGPPPPPALMGQSN